MRAAVAAVIAVPLLAAGLLVAPSALAAPQPPVFDAASYTAEIDGAMELNITGTVNTDSLGYPINWYLDGVPLCGFPADPDGTWECYRSNISSFFAPLEPGHHTITAALDVSGTIYNSTVPLRVVFPAPDLTFVPPFLNNDTEVLTGTGYGATENSEVAVLPLGDLDAVPLCTATVQLDNTYACPIERDRMTSPSGTYAVYQYRAGLIDTEGFDTTLMSDPSSSFTLSTEPHMIKAPTPTITSPAMWDEFLGAGGMTVSGTGGLASDASHDVLVQVEYSVHGGDTWSNFCAEPQVTGDAWSCTGPTVAPGKYDFRPFQLNPGEDPNHGGIISATIGVSAPVWPSAWFPGGLNNSSSEATALSGSADVGSTVVVTINGVEVCNTTAYAGIPPAEPPFGFFYCDPFALGDLGIHPGQYTASATATVGAEVSPAGDMPFAVHYPAPTATVEVNGDATGFVVSGTAYDLDASVAVYAVGDIGGDPLCVAPPAAGDGTDFTCNFDRPDLSDAPVQNYVAVQYYEGGGPGWDYSPGSTPFELSAYDIDAPAPQILSHSDGDVIVLSEQPITISGDHGLVSDGTHEVSLEVRAWDEGEGNQTLCTIASVTNSNWSCESEVNLPLGNYDLDAVQFVNGVESDNHNYVAVSVIQADIWGQGRYDVLINEAPQLRGFTNPGEWVDVEINGISFCFTPSDGESGYWDCEGEPTPEAAGLGAGIWDATAYSYIPDGPVSGSMTIPFSVTYPAPTLNLPINNGTGFTLEGYGWDDTASISIFPAGNPTGTPLCTTTLEYTGFFSCTITDPDLSAHPSSQYAAYEFPTALPAPAFSAYSLPSNSMTLSAYDIRAPRPIITAPTEGQKIPLANQPITVRGTSGLPSYEQTVSLAITYSGPSSGTFCSIASVSSYNWSCVHTGALAPGTYTLTAVQTRGTIASLPATRTFTVLPKAVPRAVVPTPTPTPTPTSTATPEPTESPLPTLPEDDSPNDAPPAAGGPAGTGVGGPAPTGRALPGAPSLLTDALITPLELVTSPESLVAGTVTAFALVIIVIIASEFFGEALSIQYALFTAFLLRRRRIATVTENVAKWVTGHRVFTGLGLVFITSLVFSFADPGFGLDLTSIRLMLSCAISIIMINFVSNLLTEGVSERLWGIPSKLVLMPWGLLVAVLGVLASRALDFSPGFLVGAILGLAVLGDPGPKLESRVIMLNFGITWGIAVGAWLLVGTVPVLNSADPASFWTTLASDSLVATASAGLTALFVMLLPFKLLDGGVLLAYSRWRWVLSFGLTCLAFAMVVLPGAAGWSEDSSKFGPWLITSGIFVVLAVTAYVIARVRSRAPKEA